MEGFPRRGLEGAGQWHPKIDGEEPASPEEPGGQAIERDNKDTIESLQDRAPFTGEKRDLREVITIFFLLIQRLLEAKMYKQVVEVLAVLVKFLKSE